VHISGKPEDEYDAEKVIEALDFGFPFSDALEIKKEEPIKHSHTGEVRMHYYDKNVDCEIVCFFDDGKMLSFKVIEKETK
jgi:hypothetical protein